MGFAGGVAVLFANDGKPAGCDVSPGQYAVKHKW
jgi:hypothetical protein